MPMPRYLRNLLICTFVLAVFLAGAGYVWIRLQLTALNRPLGVPADVVAVERGTSFVRLVNKLAAKGYVHDARVLRYYARLNPGLMKVKAGEYAVNPSDSTLAVLARISRGEVIQRSVTVPEGWNMRAIALGVEAAELAQAAEFLRLATDATFAASLGVPAASLEGYLFPDTYRFARNVGAKAVLEAMVGRFRKSLPADYEQRAQAVGLTGHKAVILASVVEKETGAAHERRLISAVFHNRLKKGMRLQSDPTVIYGIAGYDGNIRKRDLLAVTPYNTYRISGLPAGPIASPGYDALMAVVEPAPVNFLYFVSRNDGTHVFSGTLREHNAAVDHFQKRLFRKASR